MTPIDTKLLESSQELQLIRIRLELERQATDLTKWSIVLWVTGVGTVVLLLLVSR